MATVLPSLPSHTTLRSPRSRVTASIGAPSQVRSALLHSCRSSCANFLFVHFTPKPTPSSAPTHNLSLRPLTFSSAVHSSQLPFQLKLQPAPPAHSPATSSSHVASSRASFVWPAQALGMGECARLGLPDVATRPPLLR
eukprot:1969540-Pleurochrysis_carterae.AAC.1